MLYSQALPCSDPRLFPRLALPWRSHGTCEALPGRPMALCCASLHSALRCWANPVAYAVQMPSNPVGENPVFSCVVAMNRLSSSHGIIPRYHPSLSYFVINTHTSMLLVKHRTGGEPSAGWANARRREQRNSRGNRPGSIPFI